MVRYRKELKNSKIIKIGKRQYEKMSFADKYFGGSIILSRPSTNDKLDWKMFKLGYERIYKSRGMYALEQAEREIAKYGGVTRKTAALLDDVDWDILRGG
jgi:hypothetical protein